MDQAKQYIVNCVQALLNLPSQPSGLASKDTLDKFMLTHERKALILQYQQGKGLRVYNPTTVDTLSPDTKLLCLCKNGADEITNDNFFQNLTIQLVTPDVVNELANHLHYVYQPLMGSSVNPQLKRKVDQVKLLLSGQEVEDESGAVQLSQSERVKTQLPIDEIEYWIRISTSISSSESQQRQAQEVTAVYQRVAQQWKDSKRLDVAKFVDLLDQTLMCVDELYQSQHYNNQRVQGMVQSLNDCLLQKLQQLLPSGSSVFASDLKQKLLVIECQKAVRMYRDNLKKYYEQDWRLAFNQPDLEALMKRVNDLADLRNISEELKRGEFREEFFSELYEVNPFLQVGQDSLFTFAHKKVLNNLEAFEEQISNLLRAQVFKQQVMKENPLQTIREMQKWSGLLSRPQIQKIFFKERSILVSSLTALITKVETEFNSRSGAALLDQENEEALPYQVGFSKLIHQIIWGKSLTGKIKRIQGLVTSLFGDLGNTNQFQNQCSQLIKATQQFEQEQFDLWKRDVLQALKQNQLALQLSGKLLEIDTTEGNLKVNYSDKLIQLIKEVRQLCELGYRRQIPSEVIQIVEVGKRFYKEALTLKQIANFYNQMSDQIMECYKPMLIDKAITFENVVKNSKQKGVVTWENTKDLEDYVQKVQTAANEIMSENKRLRKLHSQILDIISQLIQIDLKNSGAWKEKLDQIRKLMDQGCANKEQKNTLQWRTHMEYQVFKVLEFQYKRGFAEMESSVTEIQAELILRGSQVQFKPPIEEIRDKYYQEIRRYIAYPLNFVGVGGRSEIYKLMPQRNAESITMVYRNAENVLAKLSQYGSSFDQWAIVGALDPELLQIKLPDLAAWESFMKEVRVKRKELEKINDFAKIECFNVNVGVFKSQVDDAMNNLVDGMLGELKNQIKGHLTQVQEFLSTSQEKLSKRPTSMAEMTEAQGKYMEIKGSKFEINKVVQECQLKQRLINQLSSQSQQQNPIMIQLQQVQKNWENFELLVGDFDQILAEQTKQLKQDMKVKAKELDGDLEKFFARYTAVRPKQMVTLDREGAAELAETMQQWRQQWKQLDEKVTNLLRDHDHFEMQRPSFGQYDEIKKELAETEQVWGFYDAFWEKVSTLGKEDWLAFRQRLYMFQELVGQLHEGLKQELGKGSFTKKDPIINFLVNQIELWQKIIPLLKLVVGESFEPEHWTQLFVILKMKDMRKEKLLFGDLLRNDKTINDRQNDIRELQARAQGEVTLREAIFELRTWCDTSEFELTEYQNNGRSTPLIKEWKELMTKVSDNQSLLGSLKESKFIARFKDQVDFFESKLGGIDEYLSKLQVIQRKWVYLEPIFVRGALPQEQGRFRRLDDDFRQMMLGIHRDPKVVSLCSIPGIKATLETVLDQLERCQKALNDYLEEKRGKFPRFYFLGDDDLLEILGQSQNPQVIQMHLKKLFGGIHQVEFSKDQKQIYSMLSSNKEIVQFNKSIQVNEIVEEWLQVLADNMKATLSGLLKECVKDKNLDFGKYPAQILCLSEELKYTESAVSAVQSNKLQALKQDTVKLLDSFTGLSAQSTQNPLLLLKLKSLILDIIHHNDVVDQLIENRVSNLNDWHWYKQLKYEYGKDAQIIMCKARFDYTYEYQGNAQKLVHTPLTDKCYLTLTQGMAMGYGGNPYGPAGTGKTESVKALGQLFGRQVLVFNCDEGIDFKSMGRIFMGLVKCGAWGCFDEFNRLLEEQLSAISQQISVIQHAIKEQSAQMNFMGQVCSVNKDSGIFVTLNPAGKHYGGRSKLPDNLKQLFRPVAMSVPDNELIAEVLLYAEGFKNAKILAEKVITVFTLSRQLLSPQQHYDWGLRALKTILTVAGQIMQTERTSSVSADKESELLIKSIRINTMSKLTFHDTRKFVQLMQDVFPGINSQDIAYESLTTAIMEVLSQMKLSEIDNQIAKVLQFYEATRQRMGVVLVGPSGCGKTTIWKVLKKAHEKLGIVVKTHVMNPKSMPRSQLLGSMNNDTREFSEGVLTASARLVVKEPQDVLNWIICDGDIDPEWIESLNSVLDDNHLLTLPTGERISFGNNVNFIFETSDLQYASPATVSRMGMIFLNNEDVQVSSIVTRWLQKLECSEDIKERLQDFIKQILYPNLDELFKEEENQIVPTTRVGLIMNVLSQINRQPASISEFSYLLVHGICSNFPTDIRTKFSGLFGGSLDVNEKGAKYVHLPSTIDAFDDLNEPPVIMTIGHQKDLQMLQSWITHGDPFIIVGQEGCGKNLLIQSAFRQLSKLMKIQIATIHCNAQTAAAQIIQKLNQVCAKGTSANGRVFKPKECSRLVLYLKDINLPRPDKYQTIQLIAFLQQLITHRGFYDDNLEFVYLDEKIQIVCSMNPPSTVGRHPLSTRFTANVRIYYIDQPTQEELQLIYQAYIQPLHSDSKKMAALLVDCYMAITQKFSVDDQRHYLFTPRNLTQIVFALKRYQTLKSHFPDALLNELNKSFRDRLTSQEQQMKFDQLLQTTFKKHNLNPQSAFFATLNNSSILNRLEKKDFTQLIAQTVQLYSRENRELNLVMVDEVLQLLSSLNRALSATSATAILLAGRSGIGRKTCTALMAMLLHLDFLQPYTGRDYGTREFKRDLKSYMELAGAQNKQCLLYLEDHVLLSPGVLEIVNSLIASGEVPGLFGYEEIDRMIQNAEEMRHEFYGKSLYEAFHERARRNMKIVLSMDNSNQQFAANCAANPALFTATNIIWLNSLSKDSLQHFMTNQNEQIVGYAVEIHRNSKADPRSFLTLCATYNQIMDKKMKTRGSQAGHLQKGLDKLEEANQLVNKLTQEAEDKKVLLSKKQAEADVALQQISKAMQNAAERRQETEQLQRFLQEEEGKIQGSKEKVELELKDVNPIVEEAKNAVKGISKGNLDELKSLNSPPPAIYDVLSAVMKVFKQTELNWKGMKKFLSNKQVIDQIIDFDPHMITQDIRKDVEDEINKHQNSFEKQVIYRASLAAGPLAEWVKAILRYATVLEKIAPLEKELNQIYKKLESSKNRLKQCQEDLNQLDQKVEQLKGNFAAKTSEAEILRQDLDKAVKTVQLASVLLGKLSGEKVRWQQQFESIQTELKQFPLESLLSSAYITYLSQSDENARAKNLNEWTGLCKVKSYDFLKFMSSESQILKWKASGLPGDSLTIENSAMVFASSKVPFLIDPNTQASEWLKQTLQSEGQLECLSQADAKFSNQLELAVRFGKTILIQEVDTIEGLLIPLLKLELVHQGPRWVVMIGEKAVDYNENFKMYLSTRNSSIYLPPHTVSLVQVINYTVTKSGLEGKLLSIIINIEQPDLEQKKQKLLENEEKLKMQLNELEKALLDELANSQGNILENTVLIESLNQTSSKSQTIAQSLKESMKLQQDLDAQRNVYKPLAQSGATMFILIQGLQSLNNMYRYSLSYFVSIFEKSLQIKQGFESKEAKLEFAGQLLLKNVFNQIAGSLFKQDRLIFGIHLLKGCKPDLIEEAEWQFLVGNSVASDATPLPKWASPDRKEVFGQLMSACPRLSFNGNDWEPWAQELECEKQFPNSTKLTSFQKVLVVYTFRPERVQSALNDFVCKYLAIPSVSGQAFSFATVAQDELNSQTPCLFVVSPGSDPSKELEEFAESQVGRNNFQEMSMGGNQNEAALQLIKEAAQSGKWVCLKNLHLVISFLPLLEKQFKQANHQNFRLWLTTEAHNKFPTLLLESCYKVSYEAPPGLKKNLLRIMNAWNPNFLTQGSTQRAQLMFLLTWFHALVQERRTYIPQGWSKFYEFSYGDLRAGTQIIENLIQESSSISWPTLYGLFENAIYGGRIDNEQDIKVLRAYLETYFNQNVLKAGQLPTGQQAPVSTKVSDLLAFANKMPEIDSPEFFGLPQNIDKAVQRFAIQGVVSGLKSMNIMVGSEVKFDKEKWAELLKPIIQMWDQLVSRSKEVPQITSAQIGSLDPIESFIYLEAQQTLTLYQTICQVFEKLKNVLYNNGLLTTEIVDVGFVFIKDNIPAKWSNFWEGPDSATQWLKTFHKKWQAIKNWMDIVQRKAPLDDLDLSEVFHPEIYMNALRQKTARKMGMPLNELKLEVDFQSVNCQIPVKLRNLLLQGCGIQERVLVDDKKQTQEFIRLPPLSLGFVHKSTAEKGNLGEFPIYLNASREKLLCKVKLPQQGQMNDKLIAGVALFLSQND